MPLDNPKDDALHEAAKNGDLTLIEQLLKTHDINQPHSIHFTTPLCWAAQQGKTDAVKLLLEKGALLDSTTALNKGGLNALKCALQSKNDATIEILVNATQKYLEANKKNFSSLAAASCLDLLSYAAILTGYYSSKKQAVLFGQYLDDAITMLKQLQQKLHEVAKEDFCFFYAKLGSLYLTITTLQKPLNNDSTENLTYAFAALQKAENATQQISDIELKIHFVRELADNFYTLGNAFLKTKSFQQAINCYRSAIKIDEGEKLPSRSVRLRLSFCYSHLGIAQLHLQQLKNASASYDQVQQCLNNIKNPDSKFPTIQKIANEITLSGTEFLSLKNYDCAIFCFEQVMRFYSTEMTNPALADTDCTNLSAACFGLGKAHVFSKPTILIDFANISQFLEKIKDVTLKVNYATRISKEANALGNKFFKKDNFEQAVRCYKFAIDTCKDNASSYSDLTAFYGNLAISQIKLNKFEDALASYLESSRYLTQIPDLGTNVQKLIGAFNKLGDLFYTTKNFQRANTCYEQVAKFVSSQKDQKDINLSTAYNNLGNTQILLGQSEAAVASYQKSYNYLTRVPDEIEKTNKARHQSKILGNFSPSFLSEGEFERVNICLRHSINFLQIITNPTRTDCAELSLLYSYLPQYPLYNSEYCSTLSRLFSSQGSSKDILTLLFKASHDELKSQQLHKPLICQALRYLLKIYNKEGFSNKFLRDYLANEAKKLKLETAINQFESTAVMSERQEVKNLKQKVQELEDTIKDLTPHEKESHIKSIANEATQPPITKFFKRKLEPNKEEVVANKKAKTAKLAL